MRWWWFALGLAGTFAVGVVPAGATDPAPAPSIEPARAIEPSGDAPYDSAGRRDPFRPPRTTAGLPTGEPRSPLERYELGQLRLVAVIYDTGQPRAVVEDDAGLGYIVRVGTRIGPNGGQVQGIDRGRVRVREEYVDFYGEPHPTDAVLELRTERKTVEGGKR